MWAIERRISCWRTMPGRQIPVFDHHGPDGSDVQLIDWYDIWNQCHRHGNAAGHDRTNGRIFKVRYTGVAASGGTPRGEPAEVDASVDLKKLTDDQLIDLQSNQNDWFVRRRTSVEFWRNVPRSPDIGRIAATAAANLERLDRQSCRSESR